MKEVVIATFYRFVPLPEYEKMQTSLLEFCNSLDLKGTILLASEGINSTISGSREAIDRFFEYLQSDERFAAMEWKESHHETQPFKRMKVRLKQEIVRMKWGELDVERLKGTYIEPVEWDGLISDPDVTVVDTRNAYEVRVGTFEGAINPETAFFHDFPAWAEENLDPAKHKKVAMFCTGGIRCEKSTAYLKQQGFEEVYHLHGGILKYLEETKNKNGKWQGECFVFDNRVAVDDTLAPTDAVLCRKCGAPVTADQLHTQAYETACCSVCAG